MSTAEAENGSRGGRRDIEYSPRAVGARSSLPGVTGTERAIDDTGVVGMPDNATDKVAAETAIEADADPETDEWAVGCAASVERCG